MSASKVRTDYEILRQIAQVFGQQADATRQTLQQIKQDMGVLQQGDWVGKSADKFYAEMNSALVPAVTRLQSALENAARVTGQISSVMKQAENDAARVLRGDEAGEAPGSSGRTAPQPAGLPGATAIPGSVGAAGARVFEMADGVGVGTSIGGALGGIAGSMVGGMVGGAIGAAAGGVVGGAIGGVIDFVDGTPTSRMLENLDPQVAQIAEMSPTLRSQLQQLEDQGDWTIVQNTPGAGCETDNTNKIIKIDPSESPELQVGSLAHEAAHALYGDPPFHRPTRSMTRDQFIQINVEEHLDNEGNSQFNENVVRDEIMSAGGPDTGVSGIKSNEYKQVYADYEAGTITREQAIEKMSVIIADDLTSTTGQTNRRYYSETYEDYWDTNVAPRRTP
jgi:WXG100 family type VII secretion target